MPLLIIPVLIVLAVIVLIPFSIVQRYRVGTSRQRARGWLAALNLFGLAMSTALFLIAAAITSMWVPDALRYTAFGLAGGCALGVIGLWLTRWEPDHRDKLGRAVLYYTPNRMLVLGITLVVTARIAYGFWRSWHSWRAGLHGDSWFVAAGVAGSMAAGAVVLGYYFTYWLGVRRRLRRAISRNVRPDAASRSTASR
jgi:MFS family permease